MTGKRIGIVGARGIANYGGFETLVAELAPRLVERGYEVYCSCERDEELREDYEGVKLVYFPLKMPGNYQIRKILEFFYDIYFGFLFTFKCDVVYFLGCSANIFTLFPRIFGKLSLVNMAGVEWERSKFSNFERSLLKFFFHLSVTGANYLIIDNRRLLDCFDEKYHKKAVYITYGVNEVDDVQWDQNISQEYTKTEVSPDNYWVAVARLQPDNNIEDVIRAYMESEAKKPLIIIGGFSTGDDYQDTIESLLREGPDKKIILTGGIYHQEHLNMFRQNCFGYIHAHSLGGTNPSLLEAMIMKNIIIAHDNMFNREVSKNSVLYFQDYVDLKEKLELVENNAPNYLKLRDKAYREVKTNFNWNDITDEYVNLFIKN